MAGLSPGELRRLVQSWDAVVRDVVEGTGPAWPAVVEAGSVLRPGAPLLAIRAAEARLGFALPVSYRQFLRISDGAFATPLGVVTVEQQPFMSGSSVPGLGLLSTVDLVPLTDGAPDSVAAMTQDIVVDGPPWSADGDAVSDMRPLLSGRAVMISAADQTDLTALVEVDGESEWQLWQFAHSGVTAWSSFGAWLRSAAVNPKALDEVRGLLALDWNDPRVAALKRVRDPAALPLLLGAMAEHPPPKASGSIRLQVLMTALGSIGGDEAVAALAAWLPHDDAAEDLQRIGSPAARDALAAAGRSYELLQLKDPRGAEIALAGVRADKGGAYRGLGDMPDPAYIPDLLAALERTTHQLNRLGLADALYQCGSPEGRRQLEEMAADPDNRWHHQAAGCLNKPPKISDEPRTAKSGPGPPEITNQVSHR